MTCSILDPPPPLFFFFELRSFHWSDESLIRWGNKLWCMWGEEGIAAAEDSKERETPTCFTITLLLWNRVFFLKCIFLWVKQMSRMYSFWFWAAWARRWHKEKLQAPARWNTGWDWDSPWAVQHCREIPACFGELAPATSVTKKIIKIKEFTVPSVH